MICNGVKEILLDYPKYLEIARNGRQHIIQNFNWLKITEEYEKIILSTIEKFKNANFNFKNIISIIMDQCLMLMW
ncbi:MAG: hypothetical protein CM15mP76_12710 [Prochlorococcus sp.]|nr:MAG: hypothetical protein CM15mP76_12710 [Prochlorococcus sp.]